MELTRFDMKNQVIQERIAAALERIAAVLERLPVSDAPLKKEKHENHQTA